jgi:hypothetical protein
MNISYFKISQYHTGLSTHIEKRGNQENQHHNWLRCYTVEHHKHLNQNTSNPSNSHKPTYNGCKNALLLTNYADFQLAQMLNITKVTPTNTPWCYIKITDFEQLCSASQLCWSVSLWCLTGIPGQGYPAQGNVIINWLGGRARWSV